MSLPYELGDEGRQHGHFGPGRPETRYLDVERTVARGSRVVHHETHATVLGPDCVDELDFCTCLPRRVHAFRHYSSKEIAFPGGAKLGTDVQPILVFVHVGGLEYRL